MKDLGVTKECASNKEKTLVVEALRSKYPLCILLRAAVISKSTYFYERNALKSDKDSTLKNEISKIFNEHKSRYGYRRITLVLKNKMTVNHKKVKRLMKQMGLYGITPKAKYKSYKGDFNGTVKNLLLNKGKDTGTGSYKCTRNFHADFPNRIWTTDISEFHIGKGKLYLSALMDMYNGEIVAYDISVSPNFFQILNMLNRAFKKYPDLKGLIMHSDQGWQYQMERYHKMLEERGIRQSMSRKGNCLDNSVMENFFGKTKNEMFYGHEYEFTSLQDLKQAMEDCIDYYNRKRIKVKLKGLTPCEARVKALSSNC